MRDELHQYADQLLADGEWHDYYLVISKLSHKVLPGEAMRRANSRRRTGQRLNRNPDKPLKEADVSALVRAGSRHIAAQLLNASRFEHQPLGRPPEGQVKLVRLRRQV